MSYDSLCKCMSAAKTLLAMLMYGEGHERPEKPTVEPSWTSAMPPRLLAQSVTNHRANRALSNQHQALVAVMLAICQVPGLKWKPTQLWESRVAAAFFTSLSKFPYLPSEISPHIDTNRKKFWFAVVNSTVDLTGSCDLEQVKLGRLWFAIVLECAPDMGVGQDEVQRRRVLRLFQTGRNAEANKYWCS